MPVTIHPAPPPRPLPPRRQHFDAAVRRLAPVIAEIRKSGCHRVADVVQALNAQGMSAPNGKGFTFGSTHRVLHRLKQLGLGPGPRSISKAASARPYTPRVSSPRRSRGIIRVGQLTVKEFAREYNDQQGWKTRK